MARQAPNESKETLDRLAYVHRLARQNKLTGFLFVSIEPGDITKFIVSDGSLQNPLRALGAVRLLERAILDTMIEQPMSDESSS